MTKPETYALEVGARVRSTACGEIGRVSSVEAQSVAVEWEHGGVTVMLRGEMESIVRVATPPLRPAGSVFRGTDLPPNFWPQEFDGHIYLVSKQGGICHSASCPCVEKRGRK